MYAYRIGDRVRFWDTWRGKRFLREATVNAVGTSWLSVALPRSGELRTVPMREVVRYGLVELIAR